MTENYIYLNESGYVCMSESDNAVLTTVISNMSHLPFSSYYLA